MELHPANPQDHAELAQFLHSAQFTHRHLDWRYSLDWLGHSPFWLARAEKDTHTILAALACPPDIPDYTWIRFFGATSRSILDESFALLLQQSCKELRPGMILGAVSLNDWFSGLLIANGFREHQRIVILEWSGKLPAVRNIPVGLRIRRMEFDDVDEIKRIDNSAFEPLWQNSRDEIMRSLLQSSYAAIAEINGRVVGYQISTGSFFSAHLARLAVEPLQQRLSIGYLLVEDLQLHLRSTGMDRLTVNTQHNNHASLALYEKTGFKLTGEDFPVFVKHV